MLRGGDQPLQGKGGHAGRARRAAKACMALASLSPSAGFAGFAASACSSLGRARLAVLHAAAQGLRQRRARRSGGPGGSGGSGARTPTPGWLGRTFGGGGGSGESRDPGRAIHLILSPPTPCAHSLTRSPSHPLTHTHSSFTNAIAFSKSHRASSSPSALSFVFTTSFSLSSPRSVSIPHLFRLHLHLRVQSRYLRLLSQHPRPIISLTFLHRAAPPIHPSNTTRLH